MVTQINIWVKVCYWNMKINRYQMQKSQKPWKFKYTQEQPILILSVPNAQNLQWAFGIEVIFLHLLKEGFNSNDFLKKKTLILYLWTSHVPNYVKLWRRIYKMGGGEILITLVNKADLHSADFREILQSEISCTEFHPNCQKYEKCRVEKCEVHWDDFHKNGVW